MDAFGITFEVLRETSGAIDNSYQTTGIPETFIIGKEGTIRRKWIGADDWTSQGNRALIAQLLGLETPRPTVEATADGPKVDTLRTTK
jgi:peroxiredoxin